MWTWTRAELKQRAKDVLRSNYWMAVLVSLVFTLLVGIVSGGASGSGASAESAMQSGGGASLLPTDWGAGMLFLAAIAGVMGLLGAAIGFCGGFFVTGPLTVGKNRYYLESRAAGSAFERLFYAFRGSYLRVCGGMFVTNLLIALWSILLVVPGIVKAYAWSQVGYILAENPELTGTRAREISEMMTAGEKWNIFVLDLSFIGWGLLASLAFGIGIFFLNPYIEATKAELYAVLRGKLLASGAVTEAELKGI